MSTTNPLHGCDAGAIGADEDEWEEVSDSEDGSQAPSSYPGGMHAIQSLGIPRNILQV